MTTFRPILSAAALAVLLHGLPAFAGDADPQPQAEPLPLPGAPMTDDQIARTGQRLDNYLADFTGRERNFSDTVNPLSYMDQHFANNMRGADPRLQAAFLDHADRLTREQGLSPRLAFYAAARIYNPGLYATSDASQQRTGPASETLPREDAISQTPNLGQTPVHQPPELGVDPGLLHRLAADNPHDPNIPFVQAVQDASHGDHASALPLYAAAIEGGRNDARSLTFAALSALNAGDAQLASQWSHAALRSDPAGPLSSQADAIGKLADRKLDAGPAPAGAGPASEESGRDPRPEAARPPAANPTGTSSDLTAAEQHVRDARGAFRVGDFVSAARLSALALGRDPDDVSALNVQAASLIRLGRYRDAFEAAERGLELAPGYVPLLLARALAASRLGRFDRARDDILQVLRKDPKNPAALRLLAFAEAGLGHREAMLAALVRAAAVDPGVGEALRRARALPPEGDATVLFSDAFLLGEDHSPAPAQTPGRRLPKRLIVLGVTALSGLLAAGLVFLFGRRERPGLSTTARGVLLGSESDPTPRPTRTP